MTREAGASVAAADHPAARADRRPGRRPGGAGLVAARRAFQALGRVRQRPSGGSEQVGVRAAAATAGCPGTGGRYRRLPAAAGKNADRLLAGSNAIADDARRARGRRDRRCRGDRCPLPTPRPMLAPRPCRGADAQPQLPADAGRRCGAGGAEGGPLRGAARQRQGGDRRHPDQCRGDLGASSTTAPTARRSIANLDVPERGLKVKLTHPQEHRQHAAGEPSDRGGRRHDRRLPGQGHRQHSAPGAEAVGGCPRPAAGRRHGQGRRRLLLDRAVGAAEPTSQSNLSLLRERDWIDLPLVYETGQRAILTFEKGTPGDRALSQAMTAWAG